MDIRPLIASGILASVAWAAAPLGPRSPCEAAEGERLTIAPRWKRGDTRRYELVKARQRTREGRTILEVTSRTDVTLEVEEAKDSGYLVAWTSGETRFDDPEQMGNPLVRRLTALFSGVKILMELNPQGQLVGARNWKELQTRAQDVVELVMEEARKAGGDRAAIEALGAQMASSLRTREQVEQMCLREAQLLFMVHGVELDRSAPLERDIELPNPLGGDPLPGHSRLSLRDIDETRGVAKVGWVQKVDSAAAREAIRRTLERMPRPPGQPGPTDEDVEGLTIDDAGIFAIEISTGWPHSFLHVRTVKNAGITQEDKTSIKPK